MPPWLQVCRVWTSGLIAAGAAAAGCCSLLSLYGSFGLFDIDYHFGRCNMAVIAIIYLFVGRAGCFVGACTNRQVQRSAEALLPHPPASV